MADMAAMKDWAQGGAEEGPPPNLDAEQDAEMASEEEVGEPGEAQDERMDLLLELLREFRPQIEESIAAMDPQVLLNVEEELPEEQAAPMVEALSAMGELPDMLDNIDEKMSISATQMLEEELESTDPMLFAAWLYRAGELV